MDTGSRPYFLLTSSCLARGVVWHDRFLTLSLATGSYVQESVPILSRIGHIRTQE